MIFFILKCIKNTENEFVTKINSFFEKQKLNAVVKLYIKDGILVQGLLLLEIIDVSQEKVIQSSLIQNFKVRFFSKMRVQADDISIMQKKFDQSTEKILVDSVFKNIKYYYNNNTKQFSFNILNHNLILNNDDIKNISQNPEIFIKIASFDHTILDNFLNEHFIPLLKDEKVSFRGPSFLPLNKTEYICNRSPVRYALSKDLFQFRVHSRGIVITISDSDLLSKINNLSLPYEMDISKIKLL